MQTDRERERETDREGGELTGPPGAPGPPLEPRLPWGPCNHQTLIIRE